MPRFALKSMLWTLVCGVLLAAGSARADEDLKRIDAFNKHHAAQEIFKEVNGILGRPQPIFIRAFYGPSSDHVGLPKVLGEVFAKSDYEVRPDAMVELTGRLRRLPADQSEPIEGYAITCTVTLQSGDERKFQVDVFNANDANEAVAPTGETAAPPNKPEGTAPRVQPTILGTHLFPAPQSPYHVEVFIQQPSGDYLPLKPFLDGSMPMVDLPQNAIYAVKVYNDTDHEAAVSVFIDGLSRFALADDTKMHGGLDVIAPRDSRLIKGYFRDGLVVDSFQVGEYSQSVAAKHLPHSASIGLIKVTFAACWKKGENPPPNEPARVRAKSTIRGPEQKDPTQKVERVIGQIRAVVEFRYTQMLSR